MTLHKLYNDIEDAITEEVRTLLPERSAYLTDAACVADLIGADELTDILTEVVNAEIDTALIYTARIREIWEALGEPDPEDLGSCDSINHAIAAAVVEELPNDANIWRITHDIPYNLIRIWAADNGISTGDYCDGYIDELLESIREANTDYLIDASPDLHAMPNHEIDTAIITWIAEVLGDYDSVDPAALATAVERLSAEAKAAAEEDEVLDISAFNRELERVRCYLDSGEGGQYWTLHATIDLDAADATP